MTQQLLGACLVFVPLTVVLAASTVVLLINTNSSQLTPINRTMTVNVPKQAQRIARHAWLHRDGLQSHLYVARLSETLPMNDDEVQEELPQSSLPCCELLPFIPPVGSSFIIRGSPQASFTQAILTAASDWNSVLGTKALFGTITQDGFTPAFTQDGINEVSLGSVTFSESSNILALTVIHYNSATGIVSEWDQAFNTANVAFGDVPADANVFDITTVARHEFGHVAGLGDLYDIECIDTLMYYQLSRNEIKVIDQTTENCVLGISGGVCTTGGPSAVCHLIMFFLLFVLLREV